MKIVLMDIVDIINHATNLAVADKNRHMRYDVATKVAIDPLDIGKHAVFLCQELANLGFQKNRLYILVAPGNVLTNPYVTDKIECLQEASYWCGIEEDVRHVWREQGIILPPSADVSAVLKMLRRSYNGTNRYVLSVSLGIDYVSTKIKLKDAGSIYDIDESKIADELNDEEGFEFVVDPYTFYSSISGRQLVFNSCEGIHDYLNSQADLIVREIIN